MLLYTKQVHSYRIGLGHQHGRHFTVWDTTMADVTSCIKRSSMSTGYIPRTRSTLAKIKNLSWIKQILEFVQ